MSDDKSLQRSENHEVARSNRSQQLARRGLTDLSSMPEDATGSLAQLEAAVHLRGCDVVLHELRQGRAGSPKSENFERFVCLLDLEASALSGWKPEQEPAFFLEQIRNRCFEREWLKLWTEADELLARRALPHLASIRRGEGACLRRIIRLQDEHESFGDIAISRDGQALRVLSRHTIASWRLSDGLPLGPTEVHELSGFNPIMDGEGNWALGRPRNGGLDLADLRSQTALHKLTMAQLNDNAGGWDDIRTVAVRADGQWIALWCAAYAHVTDPDESEAFADGIDSKGTERVGLYLWDRERVRRLASREGNVYSVRVAFSPDGRLLAAWHHGSLAVWGVPTLRRLYSLTVGRSGIFTPDSRHLVNGSPNGIVVQNAFTGASLRIMEASTDCEAILVSGDGKRMLAHGPNGVGIWDLQRGSLLRIWPDELMTHSSYEGGLAREYAMSHDGEWLVSISSRTISVWEVNTGALARRWRPHEGGITKLLLSPDGDWLVTASGSTIKIWDFKVATVPVRNQASSSSADLSMPELLTIGTALRNPDQARPLFASSNGRWLAVHDGGLAIHDVLSSSLSGIPVGSAEYGFQWAVPQHVSISNDGQTLAFSTHFGGTGDDGETQVYDDRMFCWNVKAQRVNWLFRDSGEKGSGRSIPVAVSPDGRWLAFNGRGLLGNMGTERNFLSMVDLAVGNEISWSGLTSKEVSVHHLTFSPDSRLLVGISGNGETQVWDVTTGDQHKIEQMSKADGSIVVFCPDSTRLALSCFAPGPNYRNLPGAVLKLLDVRTGLPTWSWEVPVGKVLGAAFSPDGQWIAVVSENVLQIVDVATGTPAKAIACPAGAPNCLAWSADGQSLLAAGPDSCLRVWDVTTGKQVIRAYTDSPPRYCTLTMDDHYVMAWDGLDRALAFEWKGPKSLL